MDGREDKFTAESAADYNDIAMNVFKPIFPHIAGIIVEKFGITEGLCIDLGAGPAPLALALARQTALRIFALDHAPEIVRFARQNVAAEKLSGRVVPLVGDVHRLPFSDSAFDLAVSRGSFPNWDLDLSFREIHRVLRAGGVAYVGVGLGSAELAAGIGKILEARNGERRKHGPNRFGEERIEQIERVLREIGGDADVQRGDGGLWITMRKRRDLT